MDKMVNFVKKHADKVLHFFVCFLITLLTARVDMVVWNRDVLSAMVVGGGIALAVGIVKELVDFFRGGLIDIKDLEADLLGLLVGMLLAVILLS